MTSVNWNDLRKKAQDAGGYVNLEVGTYNLVIIKATGKISDAGKQQLRLVMKAEDGPSEGATTSKFMTLSPESEGVLQSWFRELYAMGLGDAFFDAHSPSIH